MWEGLSPKISFMCNHPSKSPKYFQEKKKKIFWSSAWARVLGAWARKQVPVWKDCVLSPSSGCLQIPRSTAFNSEENWRRLMLMWQNPFNASVQSQEWTMPFTAAVHIWISKVQPVQQVHALTTPAFFWPHLTLHYFSADLDWTFHFCFEILCPCPYFPNLIHSILLFRINLFLKPTISLSHNFSELSYKTDQMVYYLSTKFL